MSIGFIVLQSISWGKNGFRCEIWNALNFKKYEFLERRARLVKKKLEWIQIQNK